MKKEFDCPSCSVSMVFGGGESIFQTCKSCHAPIIVPSEILYPKDQQIASGNFATLTKDVPVDPEQVTNELTPGDNLPNEIDLVDTEAKIEKFEVYQEKIGVSSVEAKNAFDKIVTSSEKPPIEFPEKEAVLERIKSELRMGDKIEAINIYREFFGTSLSKTKEIVEAIERVELAEMRA